MGPRNHLLYQMMDYEGTMIKTKKNMKNQKDQLFSIDVESIPGIPGASGPFPGAPQQRIVMKIPTFEKVSKNRFESMNRDLF